MEKTDLVPVSLEYILQHQPREGEGSDILKIPVFTQDRGVVTPVPTDSRVRLIEFARKNKNQTLFIPARENDLLVREDQFQNKLETYRELNGLQRKEALREARADLSRKLESADAPAEKLDHLRQAGENTFLLSKSALVENDRLQKDGGAANSDEIKVVLNLKETARESMAVVDTITRYLSTTMETQRVLSQLETYRDGSTLGHIQRVFVQTTKFLLYLQHNIEQGLNDKIRRFFAADQKYGRFYKKNYEQVFLEPLRTFTPAELATAGMAALLHDVGKIPKLDYFESSQGYNRALIEGHATAGYDMLAAAGEFPREVAFVAGSHHEYGGHLSGYGVRRDRIQAKAQVPVLLTQETQHVYGLKARDHLVAECVALVDVHDALRCSARKYRERPYTVSETLNIMKDMAVKDGKFNWVLFDLFVTFSASDLSGESLKVTFDPEKFLKAGAESEAPKIG